jgi:limonene-1,2-epoxide hydrolase
MPPNNAATSATSARETVLSFIQALNEEDFQAAGHYVNEEFSFVGVLGSTHGAATYLEDMKRLKIKYDIQKVFVEGADVCLLCDYSMAGVTTFGCGWYHLEKGKISSLRVVFDPRALLENASKR